MRSPDDYLRWAEEAERNARQLLRRDHRAELLEIAREWRKLAEGLRQTQAGNVDPGRGSE